MFDRSDVRNGATDAPERAKQGEIKKESACRVEASGLGENSTKLVEPLFWSATQRPVHWSTAASSCGLREWKERHSGSRHVSFRW